MIEKLFFNEYVPMNSYYAGGDLREPEQSEERSTTRSRR